MMRACATIGLLLGALLLGSCGPSADEARTILEKAQRAAREESYEGIVVRRFTMDGKDRTTTFRVHHAPDGSRYEATQPGTSRTWSLFSDGTLDTSWLEDPGLLLESYRLVPDGEDTVADRPVRRYRLSPRRPERPSRRIWIDTQTGLMLRDEGYDAGGRLVESTRFETIALGVPGPLPDLAEAEPEGEASRLRPVSRDALAREVGFEPVWPRALPDGFRLLRCHVHEGARKGAVLVYGDGLARFVITEWPLSDARRPEGPETDPEVEVRRKVRRGEVWLGLRLEGLRIDVRSRTMASDLLMEVVASLGRGGQT